VVDHAFVRRHTTGAEAYMAAIREASWDDIVAAGGVPREAIERAAA
jgi:anaerobic selenocysteine-containing dehydrogenase